MKKKFAIPLVLFASGLAAAGVNLEDPEHADDLLEACKITVKNTFNTPQEVYSAAYCAGMLEGYVAAKFDGAVITPGYSIEGFVRKANRIYHDRMKPASGGIEPAATGLMEETFKESGTKKCKSNPNTLCFDGLVLFE